MFKNLWYNEGGTEKGKPQKRRSLQTSRVHDWDHKKFQAYSKQQFSDGNDIYQD